MPAGGYQKPEKPAMVSGPGKFSQRTDGQPGTQPVRSLPDAGYGEQAEFRGLQQQAPLPDTQGSAVPQGAPGMGQGSSPVPLMEPTMNPDEPITSGIGMGAGPGPEALAPPGGELGANTARLARWLPLLEPHTRNPESSEPFRLLVRFIQNQTMEQQIKGQ